MQRILVIEDDGDISELVAMNLHRRGYEVLQAYDGITGTRMAYSEQPDLIILDIMMPGKDGFEVYKALQQDERASRIPVLFLSARAQLEDRLVGLELGADDYVAKPFSPKELMLRVQNVLKRYAPKPGEVEVVRGPFRLDKNALKLHLDGEVIDLTASEFKLLAYLVERAGSVQDRYEIQKNVWGYGDDVQTRTLDTHIKRLRQKLGPYADHLETVRGVGYCFRFDD